MLLCYTTGTDGQILKVNTSILQYCNQFKTIESEANLSISMVYQVYYIAVNEFFLTTFTIISDFV